MTETPRSNLRLILLSSGLGFVARGIETWMVELARHLPAEVETELWSGGAPPPVPGRQVRHLHGISRNSFWLRPFSWHHRYQVEQLSVLEQTIVRLRRHRPAIVYCGDPVLSWHLKRFRKWHGAKVVFMNGMRLSANWAKGFDGVHLLAPPYLEEARRELAGQNTAPFFAVPHFVDLEMFKPPSANEREAARQQLGVPDNCFAVLNVGPIGHVSGKRLEWLAEEVAAAGRPAVLLSAGVDEDGADAVRGHARRVLGDRFRFLGQVERSRMPSLYHAADVYALASLAEPFSIAILEALASGLPVVHHPDTVMRWQTGPGGITASMTEKGEAARALRSLQDEPGHRAETGAAARKLAEDRYAPAAVCRDLVAALRKVAAGQGRDVTGP